MDDSASTDALNDPEESNGPADLTDEEDGEYVDFDEQYRLALESIEDLDWPAGTEQDSLESELLETPADDPADDKPAQEAESVAPEAERRIAPQQIIEAALFVGGPPLTTKRIRSLLGGEFGTVAVERMIDELNVQYATQSRPYEIHLLEGGYALSLREQYDTVRNRVYGAGPREVRLSQDVLEVLALVAYRQPVTRKSLEETRQKNVGSHLGNLVRRELVAIEREQGGSKQVTYHTTPRFLSLFGIGSIEELPEVGDLELR